MPDFLDCAFRRAFLTAPKCRRAARRLPRGSVFCCGKRFSTLAKTAHMGGFFAPASSAGSASLPSCHSEARLSPLSVILRSFAPKNLSGHAPEPGGKILRCAQNDKGTVILRRGSLPRPTRYILYWPVKFPVAKAIVHSV